MNSTGAARRSRVPRRVSRWWKRSPAAQIAVPVLLVVLLLVIDLAGGTGLRVGGLMVAVPALSAVFLRPAAVLGITVFTLLCIVLAGHFNEQLAKSEFYTVLSTSLVIGAAAVAAAGVRLRRERQLAQARWVAAMIQRVVLRPIPRRLGTLSLASLYLAADEEAAIGGDLYAASNLDGGDARLMVGDVQGKGLDAVEAAAMLLSTFRWAARSEVALAEMPGVLDAELRVDLADIGAADTQPPPTAPGEEEQSARSAAHRGPSALEGFATAVVVDVVEDGRTLRVVNCGHPAPLLMRGSSVRSLPPATPGLPLGLGDLGPDGHPVDRHDFAVGDVLLLYTDGVIETRNAEGVFYPLAERLPTMAFRSLDGLLDAIHADLLAYAGNRLTDDVAMVAVQRLA